MLLDIFIALPLLLGLIHGFRKGFLMQAVSIVALLAGIWAAVVYAPQCESWFGGFEKLSSEWLPVVAFASVFFVVMLSLLLAGYLVHRVLHLTPLGVVNRLAGALFGFVTALIVVSVLLSVLKKVDHMIPFLPVQTVQKSRLFAPVSQVAPMIFPYLHFDRVEALFDKI